MQRSRVGRIYAGCCRVLLAAVIEGVAASARTQPPEPPLRARVQVDAQRQLIRGFGASDCWYAEAVGAQWPEAERRAIAQWLFGAGEDDDGVARGIALSHWRFNVGAGSAEQGEASAISDPHHRVQGFLNADGSYDWSRQRGQRWFLRAAREAGVPELTAYSNSPPVAMTRNGLARKTERSRASNLDPTRAGDFARFLADVLEHFRDREGIGFDYVSPINEPQWEWADAKQEGTPWTNSEASALVRALDAELVRRGLPTRILVPECAHYDYAFGRPEHPAGNQVRWFFDPASPGYVGALARVAPVFAAHSYWTDGPEALVTARRRLHDAIAAIAPPIEFRQSEYSLLGNGWRAGARDDPPSSMDCALALARVIHADLVVAQSTGWDFWTALSPNPRPAVNTRYELIALDLERRTATPTRLLWALGHWSRFVRPGWRRVDVDVDLGSPGDPLPARDAEAATGGVPADLPSARSGVMVSAFRSPDGDALAVVAVNAADTTRTLAVALEGAQPAAAWELWLTTEADPRPMHRAPAPAPGEPLRLPPRSLATATTRLEP